MFRFRLESIGQRLKIRAKPEISDPAVGMCICACLLWLYIVIYDVLCAV